MPSVVEGFMAVASAVGRVATNGKLAAATLKEATDAAKEFTAAANEAAVSASAMKAASANTGGMGARSGSSGTNGGGMSNQNPNTIESIDSYALGTANNATDQMARMIAALEAAKRR